MRRLSVLALFAVATLLAAPATGQAADGAEIAAFADEVAETWVPYQDVSGAFVDPILKRPSKYGTTMLGYGLLRAGVRRDDRALIRAGIHALNSRARTTIRVRSYFELLPFAKGYAFAKRELADNPFWRRSRPMWERYLRTFARGPETGGAASCIIDPACYHNHEAVQTAAEIALLRTGLRSPERFSPLHNRGALKRRILRDVEDVVPSFVGRSGNLSGQRPLNKLGLLSDSGRWPLAYHALSTAMYAFSLEALPARRTRNGRLALRRATGASLALMAPDGDVTWFGRRQQEAWAAASAVLVGMEAARFKGTPPATAAALRTMARTALTRLRTRHPVSSLGLANVPAAFDDPDPEFARGEQSDPMNSNGLVVFLLNLAADRAVSYRTTSIPMDHDGQMIVTRQSGVAAVRHGDVWYAVRRIERRGDLRSNFGLLALKVYSGQRWRDLMQPRPIRSMGTDPRSADVGPVIVRGGRHYLPYGLRFRPDGAGAMTIVTSFRAGPDRFTVPVEYRPTNNGIVVELAVRPTDVVDFTSFHATAELKPFVNGIGDADAWISVPNLVGVTRSDGFVSCCEPTLTAVTLRVAPDQDNRVRYMVSPTHPPADVGLTGIRSPVAALGRAATVRVDNQPLVSSSSRARTSRAGRRARRATPRRATAVGST